MVSNRDRQRAAARVRLERKMAERTEQTRRRRRIQTLIGAGAGALVLIVGVAVLVVVVGQSDDKKPNAKASADACAWLTMAQDGQPAPAGIKDVGTPPTAVPHKGDATMTITTNQGVIKIKMDAAKTPCTAASFAYLASKKFFDGTKCHRLVTQISALQCGDPAGEGTGGPSYRFGDENLPVSKTPAYPKASVAMANGGAGTNGSQFFFVYGDSTLSADYTLFGEVTQGLDIVEKVAAGGEDGYYESQEHGGAGGGHPKLELLFQSVTVDGPGALAVKSSGGASSSTASSGASAPASTSAPAATSAPAP